MIGLYSDHGVAVDAIQLEMRCPGCDTPLAYVPTDWHALALYDEWFITDRSLGLLVHYCGPPTPVQQWPASAGDNPNTPR